MFAAVAWLAGSAALSVYLGNFANYDATYGSLGAAIGLMMWLWMTAIVVLIGAEGRTRAGPPGAGGGRDRRERERGMTAIRAARAVVLGSG